MNKYVSDIKWKKFLKENKKYPVEECGHDMPPEPPMPSVVPIPDPAADPMALVAELGAIGLDPAMAQGVIDLLLSKGLLGSVADPVPVHPDHDPVGAPPMMESGIPDAEQKVANEQAYSKCHQAAMEGASKDSVMSSVVMPHDLPACSAGWDDGNNELKASQRNGPYDAEADEHYEWRHQADQELEERIKKTVIRKLKERKKK